MVNPEVRPRRTGVRQIGRTGVYRWEKGDV